MTSSVVCSDNKDCDRHIDSRNQLVCRHGACLIEKNGASVIVCPLKLQSMDERKKWKTFFELTRLLP